MKKSSILPRLLVLALVGCKASSGPAASNPTALAAHPAQVAEALPSPLPQPKYGWKLFHEETFETHTLQGKAFRIPGRSRRVRVRIQADSAVFGGAVRDSVVVGYGLSHKVFRTEDFQKMPCSLMSVDKSEATCGIDGGETMDYLVRDVRAEGAATGGLLGAFGRSSKMMEHATLPNKVQISLFIWQCIESCKSSDK